MGTDYSRWTVLVVEDTYDDARVISRILEHYKINVLVAGNGNDCLNLLEQFRPTIVVTDLAMPQMDGWATLNAIRANPEWSHIPVVAVTAYHSAEVADAALRSEFDGYFAKPLNPMTFIDQLGQVISSGR